MKKLASILLIACLVLAVFPGFVDAQDTITVVDSRGSYVELPDPVDSIVCIAPGVTEVICALGAEDKLVGIDNWTKRNTELYPFFEDIDAVGMPMASPPSYEKIIDLDPDVVISLEESLWYYPDLENKMEDAGIPVLRLNCWKPDTFASDVRMVGMIVGEKDLAEEYIDFTTSYARKITERIAEEDMDIEDKVKVYFEFKLDNVYCGDKSAEGQLLNMAGGRNIFSEGEGKQGGSELKMSGLAEAVPYYLISPEAVVGRNPEVILRDYMDFADVMRMSGPKAYGYTDRPKVDGMKKARDKLMDRPGFDETDAVEDERVYLFAFGELASSPKWPIALGYMAKWFYPDVFSDLDPQEFHEEWLSKWHDADYKGLYVYPEEE
ncbi:MAG: corrinoid ABC transporter substrate-binding protein [Candidatus Methanolliviera sp. GoM_asphalt]|nr:MAG: corrinoid ABC transporter substrate-binding protein [Candidatus Methanolliviera sp. GoM_asphalt]